MTRRRRGTDRHLAAPFCENARSFHQMARSRQERHGETSAYYLAIAIELGLKAYLLHRGTSDKWNQDHLRHDLNKTLKCVRRAGFKGVPERVPDLTQSLSPLYSSGALSRDMTRPAMPMPLDADQAGSDLLAAVEAIVTDDRRGDR